MNSFGNMARTSDALVRKAALFEMRGDDASRENAHLLWKEALRSKALPTRQELTSHYYLGSYYFGNRRIAEGIEHYEKVLQVDPLLAFLEVDETERERLRADFFRTLSAAYRSRARSVIKERKGVLAAMGYLERKVNNLGYMAAPSLLCELGSYCGQCGQFEKEKIMMRRALEAPGYGSESQEAARKKAVKFFEREAAAAEAPAQSLTLGFGGEGRKPAWRKAVLVAAAGIAAAFALYMVLMPGPSEDRYSSEAESRKIEQDDHSLQTPGADEREARLEAGDPSRLFGLAGMAHGPSADVEWLGGRMRDDTRETESRDAQGDKHKKSPAGPPAPPPAAVPAAAPAEQEGHNAAPTALTTATPAALTAATATSFAIAPSPPGPAPTPAPAPTVSPIEPPAVPAKDHRAEIRSRLEEALRLLELRNGAAAPSVNVNDPQSRQRVEQNWHQATVKSLDAVLASLDAAMALASQASAQGTEALIAKWRLRIANARSRVSVSDSFSNETSFLIRRSVAREIQAALAAASF